MTKRYLLVLLLIVLIIPSVAFAAWWNPFTWFNNWTFHKEIMSTIVQPQSLPTTNTQSSLPTSIPIPETTTSKTQDVVKPVPVDVPDLSVPTVSGCTSTQGYSSTTGLSCSGNGSCAPGTILDKSTNECITLLKYCQNQSGQNTIYNSTNNTCACEPGYVLNSQNTCVLPESGYQICSDQFPNETWDGTMTNGKYNCVCQTGYGWDSSSASCQLLQQQTQGTDQQTNNQDQINALETQYAKCMHQAIPVEYLASRCASVANQIEALGGVPDAYYGYATP